MQNMEKTSGYLQPIKPKISFAGMTSLLSNTEEREKS